MDHKNHNVAINGFVTWLLTLLGGLAYLVWAFCSDETLRAMQITYYPDKYWAIAIPAFIVMLGFYYITSSMLLMMALTPTLRDGRCISDSEAKKQATLGLETLSETKTKSSVKPFADIPVNVTSHLLYQPWKQSS